MDLLEAIENLITNPKADRNRQTIEALVLAANQEAINYMKDDSSLSLSLDLLKKVEILLSQEYEKESNDGIYKLIGLTLNNLGCYYKKTNKLKVALKYLNKALEIETETFNDRINLASTHLNMCAILSSLKQHNEAIKHAKVSLELLELEKKTYSSSGESEKEKSGNKDSEAKEKSIIRTMVMAYFNYGTELEYISDFDGSLQALKKGCELAITSLGSENSLTVSIKKAMKKVSQRKRVANEKQQKKEEYFGKQTEQNTTGRSESEDKRESVPTEKTTRALSVHYLPIRPINLKKSLKKLSQRSLDIAHDVKNIYAFQSDNIILPAIKEKVKQEDNTSTRRKRKVSLDEGKSKKPLKSPLSVKLPSVNKTLATETEIAESSVSLKKFVPIRKKVASNNVSPQPSPKGVEFEGSGSKMYQKLKEHLIQKESEPEKGISHNNLTLKKSPSQRSNTTTFNKTTVMSIKEDPYEGVPEAIIAEAKLLTESHLQKISKSRPPEEGLINADAKRRVLKHKYFISKADLSPVNIKKDLFNRNDDVFNRGPMTTVHKRALGSKKRDSKQNVSSDAEPSIQRRIKTKNHTEYGD